jgi:hypothetical protein
VSRIVPRMEMTIEPRHPAREEKNPNMRGALEPPRRRTSGPALAAEKPADELTGDSDHDEAKDPAKHVALKSAIDRRRDVLFFETPQGCGISFAGGWGWFSASFITTG